MNLPVKIRRDWHYYAFAIGLIFILNGVVGLLGFEAKGWLIRHEINEGGSVR